MSDHPSTPFTPVPLVESVTDAATGLQDAVESKAREFGEAVEEKFAGWKDLAARLLGDTEGKWKEAGGQAAAYVKENPGKAVLAGLGAGFVIGLLFRGK